MITAGWITICLEIALLLVWVYSIFIRKNGTDPAGKGMAMVFLLCLILYVVAGIILMSIGTVWSLLLVLMMGLLPLSIVFIGLWKEYGPSRDKQQF